MVTNHKAALFPTRPKRYSFPHTHSSCCFRKEIAQYGGIRALAGAMEGMHGDEDSQSHIAKALRHLSRHDQLDAHAIHAARSSIVVDNRYGLVPPDPVASANRREMASHGLTSRLSQIVDSSRHPDLVQHAAAALNHLEDRDTFSPFSRSSRGRKDG